MTTLTIIILIAVYALSAFGSWHFTRREIEHRRGLIDGPYLFFMILTIIFPIINTMNLVISIIEYNFTRDPDYALKITKKMLSINKEIPADISHRKRRGNE